MTITDQRTARPAAVRPPTSARLRRGADPNAVLALIGLGAVAVLALWWHHTASITGVGDWLITCDADVPGISKKLTRSP